MTNWMEKNEWSEDISVWLILVSFLALFFPSHILWTLCLFSAVVWAVYLWIRNRRFEISNYLALSIICFYSLIAVSVFWVEDLRLFFSSIRMKIILLALPLCFMIWSKWKERQIMLFTQVLFFALAFSAIYVLFNYSVNRTEILESILRGQSIPVPFKDHIRYSILLCFGLILAINQMDIYRREELTTKFYLWLAICLSIFGYIQFLAVKTGMLLSSLIVLCFIGYKILEKRLFLKGSIVFIALVATLYAMIEFVPTVKNKVSYFTWDIGQYKEKKHKSYSDGERIESILKGYELVEKNVWLGVGEGNLILHLDNGSNKLPHNEFIVVWAQNGIIGLIGFIAIFIISFLTSLKNKNWMAFTYTLAMFIANMLEPMLETQLGLTIFVLPLLILHSIELQEKN